MGIPQNADGTIPDLDARFLTRAKANYGRAGDAIKFRWHNHAFVAEGDLAPDVGAAIAANLQAINDDKAFLACLAERVRQRRAVSERRSPTYAPTVFAGMVESGGIGKRRLEAAMERHFRLGNIERAVLWRDTDKGRDIVGLRAVEQAPQTVAPNGPQTLFPNAPELGTRTPPNTHCISKDSKGWVIQAPRLIQDEDGGAPMP